jgi:hypothetical protein
MKSIRIRGLVKLADRTRRELAGGVSAARLGEIRQAVGDALRSVDDLLADTGRRPGDLPAPSRKALRFLASIDFDAIAPHPHANDDARPPASVTLTGLSAFVDRVLDVLARSPDPPHNELRRQIAARHVAVEETIRKQAIAPDQLKPRSRDLRGWVAYFAEAENLDACLAALERARPLFEQTSDPATHPRPMLIRFRPMKGLYAGRAYRDRTCIELPTAAIGFDAEIFRDLAHCLFRKNASPRRIVEALGGETCQAIQADLEMRAGLAERAAGVYHDLDAAFDRVNAEYFDPPLPRPRLTWSRTFTTRKLGHYNYVHDAVTIGSVLDRSDVPSFVVDFIVYHELLHKRFGARWNGNRRAVHTPEFKRAERRFARHSEAEAVLKTLARGGPID